MQFTMARSLAGHDKDRLYVVTGTQGDKLCLVDGRIRTLDRPKLKKKKHLQMVIRIPDEVKGIVRDTEVWEDHLIRKVIKEYTRLSNSFGDAD